MSKRRLILLLVAIVIALISTLVKINAADYKILNQGQRRACVVYAMETYIDVVGLPSDIGVDKAINDLGQSKEDIHAVLEYYTSRGAITGFTKLDGIEEIDTALETSPVLLVTWTDLSDWKDGNITVPQRRFKYLHATVLISKGDYYLGVNSWGKNYGFDGHYRVDTESLKYIVGAAYILTLPEAVIWR